MAKKRLIATTHSLREDQLDAIDQIAESLDESASEIIRRAIDLYLEQIEETPLA